ncbi:MAG: nicotinate (nicotinamide) nucleotide adenylyltransferase [Sphingomonadales bacterium]
MKIGLYFGSFNPIHNGHLIVANYILNETDLEKVWLVVSPQNPLKKENTLLNEYHRLHLATLATEQDSRIKPTDIEFALPKPSYTIDTLIYLKEKYPQHEFRIIMGADSFQNLSRWKNYQTLIGEYEILVYPRMGYGSENLLGAKVTFIDAPLLQLSSTYIRACIANGKSIRYMLPEAVIEEIERGGYYKK